MAQRLGTLLVEKGMLAEEQLEQALRVQRVSGGSLGTHLVNLGLVTEDDLSRALASIFGVPSVSREQLLAAPYSVVTALSPEFERRHGALPFREESNALHVAFTDPTDLLAIQEAAFLAGRRIIAHAAPEFVLHQVLSRHLGSAGADLKHQRPGDEVLAPPTPGGDAPAAAPRDPADQERQTLADLGRRLADATSRDAVLDAALEALTGRVNRGILFALKGDRAVMWRTCGFAQAPSPIALPLEDSGILAGIREGGSASIGSISAEECDTPLLRLFPDGILGRMLVLPIYVKLHPVAAFIAEVSRQSPTDLAGFNLISSLTSTALEVLILRRKILSASGADAGEAAP